MKILFHSMDGMGHMNACLGMAQALIARGHEAFFALNEDMEGFCARFSIREVLLRKEKKNEDAGDEKKATKSKEEKVQMAKHFGRQLQECGLFSGRSSLEKLRCLSPENQSQDSNYMKTLYDLLVMFDDQLQRILDEEKPDCVILDHFLLPPVFARSSIPWMLLYSGNPLPLLRDPELPPPNSGYASPRKPEEDWEQFNEELGKHYYRSFNEYQVMLNKTLNFVNDQMCPSHQFGIRSPTLNIYQYPEELDYYPEEKMPEDFARVDAFVRDEVGEFEIPAKLLANRKPGSKLIYFSLGSMGSFDVDLVKRITGILAKTDHKVIVSKGTRGDEYELPDNCWGENVLPQPKIIPHVDLVITHGGNNTVTETFAFGKPMIVLPQFGDQYDNGQRLEEKGYGVRLETYTFTEEEMLGAIDRLLNDENLKTKFKSVVENIQSANSKEKVCKKIEKIVQQHKSK